MARLAVSALAGAIFGLGLLLSGMTDTARVIGWLDIFGAWDPTLAFVMGGAILPMAVAWNMTTRRARPLLGEAFPGRPDPRIGRNLALGSALFGAGWGLAGLCPGPSLASLSWGGTGGLVFVAAMAFGMYLQPYLRARLDAAAAAIS